MSVYYENKIESLKEIFGTSKVEAGADFISIAGKKYPVIDDVIIISDESKQTSYVKNRLQYGGKPVSAENFAKDIQETFGKEWSDYSQVLEEHRKEFEQYFDLVDLSKLTNKRVADLGCGSGRWSYFLRSKCRELVLVDFSDAVFVARKNLSDSDNCLYFMCDLRDIPFKNDFCDFVFSLGVLHHLPTDCLGEVRALKKYSPEILIFLYYALDNRPFYFRIILKAVTMARLLLCRVKSGFARKFFSLFGTVFIYLPMIFLGRFMDIFGLGSHIPLYDFYSGKSIKRIEQDVYDRFFTRIEQRVTKRQITELRDTFSVVQISENLPYWHFLCRR